MQVAQRRGNRQHAQPGKRQIVYRLREIHQREKRKMYQLIFKKKIIFAAAVPSPDCLQREIHHDGRMRGRPGSGWLVIHGKIRSKR